MRSSHPSTYCHFSVLPIAILLFAAAIALESPSLLDAQVVGYGYQQAVGGISIKSDGLIENASVDTLGKLRAERARLIKNAPADLSAVALFRKVSLRGLEEALEESLKSGSALPEEAVFLAGLQDIRYVFVYPEQKDIVLVGFGEGWRIDARGNVVGITTGKPVLLLDDLLTALRTAESSTRSGISCSINPTSEGIQRLRAHVATLTTMNCKRAISSGLEKALGRQLVTFTGVPTTSHFASVLVAADYRMKRLAMNFEPSPVHGMPSFLQMYSATSAGMDNVLQRWWLEPKYESVLCSPDGLAWQFIGAGVKCLTEEDFATANGQVQHEGKPSVVAQKWADNMTGHYDELAVAEPVFGDLCNCMQLALVGALAVHERLADKAGCNLPALMQESTLKTFDLPVPSQVDSRVSMVKQGHNWIIGASGGVKIRPGEIIQQARESSAPADARAKAQNAAKSNWYWN
ncbi:MAG: DUF1598 domain-containing protein [Thermoguttaceae bacterium]